MKTIEHNRLNESKYNNQPWKFWGPYLSERQWGTVREDYSSNGNAWDYFPHDHARSRAYRWGEDGIAGISDEKQKLCFAMALWNGNDPIIKERLFGLTNSEGNHGEDVKEYYFYLDSTPTHSYMKYLYKYPHNAYPYEDIVLTNRYRSRNNPEYELIDTGIFDEDKYFDVFVEYAKAETEDILIRFTVANRSSEDAKLHLLPTLWFRNTWSWDNGHDKPLLERINGWDGTTILAARHKELGDYYLYANGNIPLLFTENETNNNRLFNQPNASPYVKDGINDYFINADNTKINPNQVGTKASVHFELNVKAHDSAVVQLRLSRKSPEVIYRAFGEYYEQNFDARKAEADDFYNNITPSNISDDEKNVFRQALAGMLWTKQYYYFDIYKWLQEHNADPFTISNPNVRNSDWYHMVNDDIISMPDKWEYPWFAAWDLAFHAFALSLVDFDFAKTQLNLMLDNEYLHPNGQIPAYEWNFGDVNPPVHAIITLYMYNMNKELNGKGDIEFLKTAFNKLLLNFTWWVNRKDRNGKNIFGGGFLGMDNIGVFDRSSELPTGGYLEQADGTAWMVLYTQNMLEICMEIALHDPSYESLILKFAEHFAWISYSMDRIGDNHDEMWSEKDGFFFDVLRYPDGNAEKLKVYSMVGLLPMCAVTIIKNEVRTKFPHLLAEMNRRIGRMTYLKEVNKTIGVPGCEDRRILTIIDEHKLRKILSHLLNEDEFLSDYGIRTLSKIHEKHPFKYWIKNHEYSVEYVPGDSNTGMFGGNSNWRGPIWMPVSVLILRALKQYYLYFGDEFKVECPVGSGKMMNLYEVYQEITRRMVRIFTRNSQGQRPVYGSVSKFQNDPHWKDLILFYEFFHGDTGLGLGASHQTGWSGVIAQLIKLYGIVDSKTFMKEGLKIHYNID